MSQTRRDDRAALEQRVAGLAKRALPPAGLDDDALARVWRRLKQSQPAHPGRVVGRGLTWALGVALSLVISGGMVAAGTGAWTWPRAVAQRALRRWRPAVRPSDPRSGAAGRRRADAASPTIENATAQPQRTVASIAPVGEVSFRSPPQTVAEPDLPSEITGEGPVPKRPSARPASSSGITEAAAATPPSTLAAESGLLLRALHELRRERDPEGCLRELDRYAAQFPSGILSHEAERARIDALLMAGRRADARAALSQVTLGDGARDVELLLIRAELWGEDDCPRALPDYELVLAPDVPSTLAARALWGRAVCRSRLGDEAGARADLAAYLGRYPAGSHAAAARQRLAP